MPAPIILCADGSELSIEALAAGVALLPHDGPWLVAHVMSEPDPMLVTGTGFAGGVTTPEDYAELHDAARDAAAGIIAATVEELGLTGAEQRVLTGSPGPALCELADEVDADAIVIGTRGSSGLRRAVMGSVSDHVVRRAPCPVVVTSPAGLADDDD